MPGRCTERKEAANAPAATTEYDKGTVQEQGTRDLSWPYSVEVAGGRVLRTP